MKFGYFARIGVAICWLLFIGSNPLSAAVTDPADGLIAAVVEASGQSTPAAVAAAQSAIDKIADAARQRGDDPATLLSARIRILQGLQRASELESAGDLLEALRMLVRVGALSAGLADAETPGDAGKRSLDKVTDSIYGRLVRLGATDQSGNATFAVNGGERLIYRMFVADKGKLTAFELVGNERRHTADWRQTVLPMASDRLRAAVLAFKPSQSRPRVDRPTGKSVGNVNPSGPANPNNTAVIPDAVIMPAFALLVGYPDQPASSAVEDALSETLAPLAMAGVLPIIVEHPGSGRPVLSLPSVPATAVDPEASRGIKLIELSTGAVVVSYAVSDQRMALAIIARLVAAISTDLELGQRPIHPRAFVPALVPATDAADDRFDAVPAGQVAALLDSQSTLRIEPWFPLQLLSRFGGEWGLYGIHGRKEQVWLRPSKLGPFIEYPQSLWSSGLVSTLFGAPLDAAGSRLMTRAAVNLKARPFGDAVVLRTLATASPVDVMFVKPAEHTPAELKSIDSQALPPRADAGGSAKPPALEPAWAFVRTKSGLGWVEAAGLVEPAPVEGAGPPKLKSPGKSIATPTARQ